MIVGKVRDRKPGPRGAGGGGRAATRRPLPSQRVFCHDRHSQVGRGHSSPSGSVQQHPGALPRLQWLLSPLQCCSQSLATAQAVTLGLPGALRIVVGDMRRTPGCLPPGPPVPGAGRPEPQSSIVRVSGTWGLPRGGGPGNRPLRSCLLRAHGGVSLAHGRGPLCSSAQGLSCPPSGWTVLPSVPEITALARVKLPSAFPLPTPAAHRGDKEPEVPSGPREEVVEAGWRPGPFLQPLGFKAGMSPGSGRVWRGVAFPQGERLSPALWRAGAGRTP